MSDVPLGPEPVLGWRAWRLERRGGGLRLVSLTRPDAWPPMDAMQARCDRGQHASTPAAACSCGIYATREPEDLPRAGITGYGVAVVGAIAMWGRVVEHDSGARAQKAYPARLRLVCGGCLTSGAGAVDPVRVVTRGATLEAVCARHAPDATDGIDARAVQWELLATYAVDLLPHERVADALKRPPSPRPSSVRRTAEAIVIGLLLLVRIAMSIVMTLMLVGWFVGIASLVFGVVEHLFGLDPAGAAPSAAIAPHPAYVLADYPELDPPMRVICGQGAGDSIEFAPCAGAADDVIGVATQAPGSGPFADCLGDWVAYSFDEDHRVCWHPAEGEDPDVRPNVTAPDPFDDRPG